MVPKEQTFERKFKCVFEHLRIDEVEEMESEDDEAEDVGLKEAKRAEAEMMDELERARTKLMVSIFKFSTKCTGPN